MRLQINTQLDTLWVLSFFLFFSEIIEIIRDDETHCKNDELFGPRGISTIGEEEEDERSRLTSIRSNVRLSESL